jgi:hypothetical protein
MTKARVENHGDGEVSLTEFKIMIIFIFIIFIISGILFLLDSFKKVPPDLPLGEDDMPLSVEAEAANSDEGHDC